MLLDMLAVVVGFAAVILSLSLAVTAIVEMIVSGGKLRNVILRDGLQAMMDRVFSHSRVSIESARRQHPALLPRKTIEIGELEAFVHVMKQDATPEDIQQLRILFPLMERRTSEVFKFRVGIVNAVVSLLVAGVMQVSAPALVQRLSVEPGFRAAAIALGEHLADAENSAPVEGPRDALDRLEESADRLASIDLRPFREGWGFYLRGGNLVGIILTAAMLSMGAPFWFDFLSKVVGILRAAKT